MPAIALETKFGPLLSRAVREVVQAATSMEASLTASAWSEEAAPEQEKLPVVIKMPTITVQPGETWRAYRQRVEKSLLPLRDKAAKIVNAEPKPIFAGNALQSDANPDQLQRLAEFADVAKLELDPMVELCSMDDCVLDVDVAEFAKRHKPHGTGRGVIVAVLDSGIDTMHPYLKVARSFDTSGQGVDIPGKHGTHCAGSLASRDKVFPGVAPGVTLLNVKVVRADGRGKPTNITLGIDRALDEKANVISISLAYNHLPIWSDRGHGWTCKHGNCPLCLAVDNATTTGAVVVAAAGNDHERAESLRASGSGHEFDTELGCPGQSRNAVTVAAVTKRTFLLAPFSSHGPTSYGADKPDLCAPGVNITSTIPAPRNADGTAIENPPRATLFGRDSGTSMATPMVAGAAALIIQRFKKNGVAWTPAMVRNELLTNGIAGLHLPPHQIGAGRLFLQKI